MPSSYLRHSLDDPPSRARQIASSFRRRSLASSPASSLPSKRPAPDYLHPDSPPRAVIRRTDSSSSMSESPDSEPNCNAPSSPVNAPSRPIAPHPEQFDHTSPEHPSASESNQPEACDFVIVPAEHVGLIIGKHGDTIKAIQNSSNAIVSMDRSYPSRDRKFRISGTEDAVSHCRSLIERRLEAVRNRSDSALETREMWIPVSKIGLVIGAGGATIRSIKEKTGAYATVHNDQVEADRKLLTIHGTAQQASHARQIIVEILQSAPHTPSRDPSLGASDDSTAMYIPRAAVGSVIGSRGTTLRSLHQKSGAFIRVASDEEAGTSPERQIIISGSAAAVHRARSMIHFVIREGSLRHFDEPHADIHHLQRNDEHPIDSFSRMRDIRRRAYSQGRKEDSFILSAEHIGLLIGKNGTNIREMQNRSGAIIEVTGKNESERESSHRTVSIFGSPTEVKIAKLLIEEKIGINHEEQKPDAEQPNLILAPQDSNIRPKSNCNTEDVNTNSCPASKGEEAEKDEHNKENAPSKEIKETSTVTEAQRVSKTTNIPNKERENETESKDDGGHSEDSLANTAVESILGASKRNSTDEKQRRVSQNSRTRSNSGPKLADLNKRHSKDGSKHHGVAVMQQQHPSTPVPLPQPHHSYAPPLVSHPQYHPHYPPPPTYYGEPNLSAYPYYGPPPPHSTYAHSMPAMSTPISVNGMEGVRSLGSPHGSISIPCQQSEAVSATTTENSKSESDKRGPVNNGSMKTGNSAPVQPQAPAQFYPTFYQQQPGGPMMYPTAPPMYGGYVFNQHPSQFNPGPNDYSGKGLGTLQTETFVHPFAVSMSPGMPVPQHGTSMSPVAGSSV
ncbi:unnamed protein product [Agarophyton chilense]|eukprot:gb/GEZJ01001965.1/.p1 GENE.gb/GEZJ01001965.1/~~gb/GEZJ01001965.1/.p1  ORF type:complete len:845 (+),score=121.72 gb/GEZJ01001965.1/:717-3251(+)